MTQITHPTLAQSSLSPANHSPADSDSKPFVLWRDFKPRDRGVLDLIDDMLERLVESRLRLFWVPGIVTEIPLDGGESQTFEFAYRNSIFRLIMARMAVLCEESSGQDVSPYGGTGSFTDPRWPHVRFHVEFVNTKTADQHLKLTPAFASEPS